MDSFLCVLLHICAFMFGYLLCSAIIAIIRDWRKDYRVYNWIVYSEEVNDDSIVNYKTYTYKCPRCNYISDVASGYCPDCGCCFSNYDLYWKSKLKVCNSVFEKE